MSDLTRVIVRTARDDDDLDELNAGNPVWMSQELLRASVAAAGETPIGLWVATLDDVPAGFAAANGSGTSDGHRGGAYLYVRPGFRRHGVGTALWTSVLEICTPERVNGVLVQLDANDLVSRDVALAHGLEAGNLHLESRLSLQPSKKLESLAKATSEGLTVRTLGPDASEADWQEFAEVFNRLYLETPDQAGGSDPVPYPILRSLLPEPWQVMAAWRGERLVGFTSVMVRNGRERTLNTLLTGVERDQRGSGLSTVLKANHALSLGAAGWRSLITHNMEGNEPILASNRRLGFEPAGGVLDLLYDFGS